MSEAAHGGRPPKRVKMDHTNSQTAATPSTTKATREKSQISAQKPREPNQPRGKSKYRQQATINASGILNDDVGIFVTSDKGQEKRCLQEMADLLGEVVQPRHRKETKRLTSNSSLKKIQVHDVQKKVKTPDRRRQKRKWTLKWKFQRS